MMGLYRTDAVVLRSRKYLEADSLLTLLTDKKGKISAIAKGVRKPQSRLRGGVQIFTHNAMLLHEGKSLDIVTQSECVEPFIPLQDDFAAIAAASYWSELVFSLIPEGEADPGLFQLTLAGFHVLCLSTSNLVIRGLEIKLLAHLGYTPLLEQCVSCGQKLAENPRITFSVRHGGVLCSVCSNKEAPQNLCNFSHEALNVWQQLVKMDLSKINRLRITPRALAILDDVVEEFLLAQLEYPLKSRPILKKMLQAAQE